MLSLVSLGYAWRPRKAEMLCTVKCGLVSYNEDYTMKILQRETIPVTRERKASETPSLTTGRPPSVSIGGQTPNFHSRQQRALREMCEHKTQRLFPSRN